ncbi:glycosyltransferase family 2 protein [Vibrio cholerae]|nr:glycosyltransferase family 2 protein [Vibrio cholerae]EJB8378451.1 glycosyltransferase family 2 protein [Vibrio cholerae]
MLISIIIPAYNAESYIGNAIRSCLDTEEDVEIIVINDGSSDTTKTAVEAFLGDQRVKLINKVNEGVAKARNVALDISSGKYVLFLDADDYFVNGAIDILAKAVRKSEKDLYLFGCNIFYSDKLIEIKHPIAIDSNDNIIEEYLKDRVVSAPWGKLFKRKIIEDYKIRFPNLIMMEDGVFLSRFFKNVVSFGVIKNCLYNYRKHGGGISSKINVIKFESMLISMEMQREEIINSEIYSLNVDKIENLLCAREYNFLVKFPLVSNTSYEIYSPLFKVRKLFYLRNSEIDFKNKIIIILLSCSPFLCRKIIHLFNWLSLARARG